MGTKRSSSLPALISLKELVGVPQITYIRNPKFTIGRGNESSLRILHKAISRKHCTIEKENVNEWTITANSSNVIKLNGISLPLEVPSPLRCADKIDLVGVTILVFKCSPDQNQKCCSDFKLQKTVDTESVSDIGKPATILSQFPTSSSSNSSPRSCETVRSWWLPNDADRKASDVDSETLTCKADSESQDSSSDLENQNSLSTIEDLQNSIQEYRKYADSVKGAEPSNGSQVTSLSILDDVERGIVQLKRLRDFNTYSSTLTHVVSKSPEVTLKLKQLVSSIKNEYPMLNPRDRSKCDEKLSRIVALFESRRSEYTKSIMCNICTLLESSCDSTPQASESSKINESSFDNGSHSSLESKASSVKHDQEDTFLKNELKDYKQNAEWQEARIQYLEMKLKERDKLEVELETAKERNEALETYNTELKRTLAKKEVVELELQLLKETYKYKEDDKRSKDALEREISNWKDNAQKLKEENEKLTSNRYLLESEIAAFKQKCEELETKLKEKNSSSGSGCSSNSTSEYCCDMVKEVKGSLIDLMEKEFNCCICGDIFIEATVTNCNHVFCAYCLKEWKKKKKQCPFCRANITKECRAPVVDEFITNLTKLISDKSYAERVQLLDERKSAGTPPAKRQRRAPMQRGMMHHAPPMVPYQQQNPFHPTATLFPYQQQQIDIVNLL